MKEVSEKAVVNILAMKWGTIYGSHYVNRLYASVQRNLKRNFRFICFTDDTTDVVPEVECHPIPNVKLSESVKNSPWRKLGVFRKNIADLQGSCLFLDLDIVLVDSIDELFDYKSGAFCISHTWWMPQKHLIHRLRNCPKEGNTSVFRFEADTLEFVITEFENNSEKFLNEYELEQQYVTSMVLDQIQWWPKQWVRSFRRNCRPSYPFNLLFKPYIPNGTKIVVFHGLPNPDQASEGVISLNPRKFCRRSPWIAEHWRDAV